MPNRHFPSFQNALSLRYESEDIILCLISSKCLQCVLSKNSDKSLEFAINGVGLIMKILRVN